MNAGEFVAALAADYRTVELDPVDRSILDYAIKLNDAPWEMTAADILDLRSHGLDDLAIHDLATVAGYFAFVNRIADGLGVDLEHRFD